MLKNSILGVVLSVFLYWPTGSWAHTFIYNLVDGTPVFSVDFPDGWRLDLDFDPPAEGIDAPPPPRVVEAIPKDGAKLWLGTWVLTEIADVADARAYFESLEQYILNDVVIEEAKESDLNGMEARTFRGSAKKGKEPVEWVMAFFTPRLNTVAGILYIGVPKARRTREAELRGIVESIRSAG